MLKTILTSTAKLILTKLISEKVLIEITKDSLFFLAKRTNNVLDDRLATLVANALTTTPPTPSPCRQCGTTTLAPDGFCSDHCRNTFFTYKPN